MFTRARAFQRARPRTLTHTHSHTRTRTRTYASASNSVCASEHTDFEVVVGVEIHAQLQTRAKLFSASGTSYDGAPNTQVTAFDAALPGTLPHINRECVRLAVMTGLAIGGEVQTYSRFDRKHYFYADLPLGYQITQQFHPIVRGGSLTFDVVSEDNTTKRKCTTLIERIHMEIDSGKSLHDQHPNETLVDLNRAGMGLIEIVTEPNMRSGAEAAGFLRSLQSLLVQIGACEGTMAEGALRCDANVSVRPRGSSEYGVRCEIKNLNSARFVQKAIEAEAQRHIDVLTRGGSIEQQTRSYDAASNTTDTLRSKEDETDYRFFPEPDLPPLRLETSFINDVRETMPETPQQTITRLSAAPYSLKIDTATQLVANFGAATYFEELMSCSPGVSAQKAAQWVITRVFALVNTHVSVSDTVCEHTHVSSHKNGFDAILVRPTHLAELLRLLEDGLVTMPVARDVWTLMAESAARNETPKSASEIVRENDWESNQRSSEELESICQAIIDRNPKEAEQYRNGRHRLLRFFVGQVMKETRGKTSPQAAQETFERLLGASSHEQDKK